jgi:predicted DNA-binding transcriptional regulator
MNLPRKKNIKRVHGIDILLNRAMDKICRRSNGQVLRLCVAYTFGELSELCAVVDEFRQNVRDQQFTKSLIGVWNVTLPKEMVVWVENASTSVELMNDLVGKEVQDKTPQGSLEYKVAPIQYATTDVTKSTSPNVVRSVVRGLLAKYPDAKKIGIITQQVHVKSIKELNSFWFKRINKIEYYFSGKDRASNSWLDCDLILVIGTPRVPPSAIRELLIRLGKIDSAAIQDKFLSHIWQGLTVDGTPTNIECVGYSHNDWIMAYNLLVRETLRQAIGRGRGVCDHGVPVVVVSNENLGCDLGRETLIELSDQVESTYRIAHGLIIEKGEIDTKMIAEKCKMSVRTTTDHLNTIVSLGLLERKSQRGAWILPPITKLPEGVDID